MLSDGSALVGGSNQAGELFLNIWDATAATSYELDLGGTLPDFYAHIKNTQVWVLDQKFKDWSATNHTLTFNIAANNSYIGKNSAADGVLLSSLTGFTNTYNVNMQNLIKLQNNVSARAQSINVDAGINNNYAANLSTVTTNKNSSAYFDDAYWGTAMGITGYAGSATVRNGGTNETLNLVYIHSPGGTVKGSTKATVEYLKGHLSLDPTGSTLTWTPTLLSANKLIHGSADNDTLKAGNGNDTLTGGTGKDVFKLTTLSKVTITDFSVVDDTIQLDHSIFTKLTAIGNLNGANFKIGAPTDNNDYITYNSANGIISYDADGNGKGVATQIAVVGLHLGLTNLDFVVI